MPVISRRQGQHETCTDRVAFIAQPVPERAADCWRQIPNHWVGLHRLIERTLEKRQRDRAEQRHGEPVEKRLHNDRMRQRGGPCKLVALALLGTSILASCEQGAPQGQVIARVDGEDVTWRELAEVRRGTGLDQSDALETLVTRKILAREAEQRGLEQDGDYHFAMRAARDALLAEALQRDIRSALPRVADEAVDERMAAQPWRFGERFLLDISPLGRDEGEYATRIDSADYTSQPPAEILAATVGAAINLNGGEWRVSARMDIAGQVTEQRERAFTEINRDRVQARLARYLRKYRLSGKILYQRGYGPAGR